MSEPMRIRAVQVKDLIEVKLMIRHPMESGLRKDENGKKIPAHFIETLEVKCKDKLVFDAYLGMAVSENPFLQFSFKDGAKGDMLEVTWKDNRGDTRTDKAAIS
jgi:sulfur-oxidizing protein SoxZ